MNTQSNTIKALSKLPIQALSDDQLNLFGKKFIKKFRGVFMRNLLPAKIKNNECGVVNLGATNDLLTNHGTHWVAYYKNKQNNYYFDSFGDIPPPIEIVRYFNTDKILYNYNRYQNKGVICGHLCLAFLINITNKYN